MQKKLIVLFFAIILIVFLFFLYFSKKITTVKNTTVKNTTVINTASLPASVDTSAPTEFTLFFSSFFDNFVNDYYIDANRTNLYRDNLATAFIFPPDYTWREADTKTIALAEKSSSRFAESVDNKSCLGNLLNNCLEQKGNGLVYQGKTLSLPPEIKNQEIANISISALSKRWLVGITLKNRDNYNGLVYYFDGKNFTPLLIDGKTNVISSPYLGTFGFGGEESDFLIIYGAYKGIAYRVQNDQVEDISDFFDYRIMDRGFHPEIIKVKSDRYINWYVFSLTPGRAKLIKLWENESNKISGELVFKEIVFFGDEEVSFRLLNNNASEVNLLARVKSAGAYSWRVLSDRGFKNNFIGELIFNPVSYNLEITIKKLANISIGLEKQPCPEGKLSFSQDNKNWQPLPRGINLNQNFSAAPLNKFFLRVDFPAQENKFFSPFLSGVLFDIYYQK